VAVERELSDSVSRVDVDAVKKPKIAARGDELEVEVVVTLLKVVNNVVVKFLANDGDKELVLDVEAVLPELAGDLLVELADGMVAFDPVLTCTTPEAV
jgi:hypothetical protein